MSERPAPPTPPFAVGLLGGLAALACAIAFRFLVSPDPDPTWRATYILGALAFAVCFGISWWRERRREKAAIERYLRE